MPALHQPPRPKPGIADIDFIALTNGDILYFLDGSQSLKLVLLFLPSAVAFPIIRSSDEKRK